MAAGGAPGGMVMPSTGGTWGHVPRAASDAPNLSWRFHCGTPHTMKNQDLFQTTILREVAIGGLCYHPGDTALVNAEIFRELVAIFAADPKDRLPRHTGKPSAENSSH